MNRVLAHNFAGAGHQVPFKASGQNKGHVTRIDILKDICIFLIP